MARETFFFFGACAGEKRAKTRSGYAFFASYLQAPGLGGGSAGWSGGRIRDGGANDTVTTRRDRRATDVAALGAKLGLDTDGRAGEVGDGIERGHRIFFLLLLRRCVEIVVCCCSEDRSQEHERNSKRLRTSAVEWRSRYDNLGINAAVRVMHVRGREDRAHLRVMRSVREGLK